MSQFVFFAALLGLIAIAFAVSALWQRSRALALALAVGLPLLAAGLYYLKGEPAALDPKNLAAPTTPDEAIAQLQRRIAADPGNVSDLVVLARFYMAQEKYPLARDTYARAVKLQPDDGDLSVEYAESLLRSSPDRHFPPEAVTMLEAAVVKNPGNERALFFLGVQRMQAGQPAEAARLWEKLLPLLPPDAAGALRPQIDAARAAAGLAALPAVEPVAGPTLTVEVRIDPTLANLVKPGDVLYVYARSLDGRGPPFAAKRIVIDKLPLHTQLSDADSPMPAARLSSQKLVSLVARVSRSGDVSATSGDIEADPLQVEVTAGPGETETIVLNRVVP